jgi:DNA polymerase-3 subunit epsilon
MSAVEQPARGALGAPWNLGSLASYDCETTGISIDNDRIVTAALVMPGREPRKWLADPGIDIPKQAAGIHGVSTEHAREHGQPAALVIDEIAEALADELATRSALVVMNAPFDLSLLDRECARHGLPTVAERPGGGPFAPVIDPLVLDRAADRYRKGRRTLEDLARHYGVKLTDAHTADADAQAALDVALAIAEAFPELQVPGRVLHGWQIAWHARWAEGYARHLSSRGNKRVDVDGRWPVIPAPAHEGAEA